MSRSAVTLAAILVSSLWVCQVVADETLVLLGYVGNLPGEARAVAVHGNYVFVAEGSHFLSVVDITDPQHPVRVTELNPAGNQDAQGIAYTDAGNWGQYVWVGDAEQHIMYQVNVADPLQPTIVNQWSLPGGYLGGSGKVMASTDQNRFVYVSCWSDGLCMFRVWPEAGPCTPYVWPDHVVQSFTARGETAFGHVWIGGGGWFRGIRPGACDGNWSECNPIDDLPAYFNDAIMPDANRVWIAAADSGIYEINVTNCDNLGRTRPCTPAGGWAKTLDWTSSFGGRLVVGSSGNDRSLVLMDDAWNQLSVVTAQSGVSDVEWKDDLVVVADVSRVEIFQWRIVDEVENQRGQVAQPAEFVLSPCFPNPFNPVTTVTLETSRDAATVVGVYDLNGRLVRVLHSGTLDKGSHVFVWDGRNGEGAAMTSGVYFCCATAQNRTQTQKMLLVR